MQIHSELSSSLLPYPKDADLDEGQGFSRKMLVQNRPIPALYTVYILRSTVRHASLYIGSTPNPPRRLSQHNGLVRGGAARTSRASLRPWEMVGLVSGFPSMTAALQFEWALTNPHITLHIPSDSRITVSTQAKANGQPRRPPRSIASVLSNLGLLLRVPSFARWPLKLHFFNREVHAAWERWCAASGAETRPGLVVETDFEDKEPSSSSGSARGSRDGAAAAAASSAGVDEESVEERRQARGIHALPLDYEPIKDYVAKSHEIFEFERQGECVVCGEELPAGGEGLYAVCTNAGCEGAGHLACWGRHMISKGEEDAILPVQGRCPRCNGEIQWAAMMTELTLRLRGKKEVDKLLRRRRRRAARKASKS